MVDISSRDFFNLWLRLAPEFSSDVRELGVQMGLVDKQWGGRTYF
jgi:hypothetical protein